jgi:Fusaric acid resistance protein-like
MEALNAHQKRLAGLARAVRAAVVVPSLFALGLLFIKQPEAAGFAVLGTFAHLVMVNYDPAGRARSAQSAMLTLLGAIMVSLGTLASANVWLAVGATIAVGFLTEFPTVARSRIAVLRPTLLLSFMLGVAVPASASSVFPHLAGWLLAGLVAQPALLLFWIPFQPVSVAGESGPSHESLTNPVRLADPFTWIGNATAIGVALGLAVLLTRLLRLDHAFWVVLGVLAVLSARGTSSTRRFLQEQAGTLIGFLMGAALVALIGAHQTWYWFTLPIVVFVSAYASSAVGFIAGQAAFAVFAVVLFCILLPQQRHVGLLRVEDIAIGGSVSLVVGSLRRLGEGRPLDCLRRAVRV